VCSGLLHKVEKDLHKENNVNSKLNFDESLLVWLHSLAHNSIFVTCHVDLLESEDEWSDKEGVDNEKGNHEVPHLAEGPLGVDQVPLKLWLTIDYLILFISIFVDVIDHHLLQIGLSHLLKTSLESKLVVVTSCFAPECLDALVLLLGGHCLPLGLSVVGVGVRLALTTAAQDPHQEALLLATIVTLFTGFLISTVAPATTASSLVDHRVIELGSERAHLDVATWRSWVHFIFR
jgi:hypothetical protein